MEISGDLFRFLSRDFADFGAILLFLDVSRGIQQKNLNNLEQCQKGNSYLIEEEVYMSLIHATKPNLFHRIFQGGVDNLAAQTVPAELDPFAGFGSEFCRQ